MISHWLVIGLAAIALARPETYKENEEFNYARSSTDEGSKSGFYEAQRGNVGGNYERAHNMDGFAQGQMSDAIRQSGASVDEVSRASHGNLRSQAYSSGVYGQRPIDTSNLAGRRFDENSYGASASASQASRYQQAHGFNARVDDCGECVYTAPVSDHSSHSSYRASSHHDSTAFDQNSVNSDVSRYRTIPVKIVARPQYPVNLNVQAGIAGPSGHHEKHYESSYKKEWERHSEVTPIPLAIPASNVETIDDYSQNYRQNQYRQQFNADVENLHTNAYNHQAGVHEKGYESKYNSEYQRVANPASDRYVVLSATPDLVAVTNKQDSSSSQHASAYTAGSRSHSESLARGHLGTNNDNLLAQYNSDALTSLTKNTADTTIPGPKAYESSYSYHKSWERQGDPYIIEPASSAHSENYRSHYANSRYTHGTRDDCDDDDHQRHTRSVNYNYGPDEQIERRAESLEDYGQRAQKAEQLRDMFGQQTEDLGQFTENLEWYPGYIQSQEHSQGGRQHVDAHLRPISQHQYTHFAAHVGHQEQP